MPANSSSPAFRRRPLEPWRRRPPATSRLAPPRCPAGPGRADRPGPRPAWPPTRRRDPPPRRPQRRSPRCPRPRRRRPRPADRWSGRRIPGSSRPCRPPGSQPHAACPRIRPNPTRLPSPYPRPGRSHPRRGTTYPRWGTTCSLSRRMWSRSSRSSTCKYTVPAPIAPKDRSRSTTSSGVPAAPLARNSSGWRPIDLARRVTSASSIPHRRPAPPTVPTWPGPGRDFRRRRAPGRTAPWCRRARRRARLNSSAKVAANRGVRLGPPPPTINGGWGRWVGLGRAGLSFTR